MDSPKFIDHSNQIQGLWEVELPFYEDKRGANFEGLNHNKYPEAFKPFFDKTPVDSFSVSIKNSLRGFHGDSKNYKLIQLLAGKMQFVVLDGREESFTYLNQVEFIVDAATPRQFLLPPKVLNAHLMLSEFGVFSYKLSEDYAPISEQIHFNYTKFHNWHTSRPILSERDE